MAGIEPAAISERVTFETRLADHGDKACLPISDVRKKRKRTADSDCWACNTCTDSRYIKLLNDFFYNNYALLDEQALFDQLDQFFELEVRSPIRAFNDLLEIEKQEPIPVWSKESMQEHYEKHTLNPSVENARQLRRLRALQDELFDSVVEERADGARRVNGERLRQIDQVIRLMDGRFNAKIIDQNFYSTSTTLSPLRI